MWYNTSCMGMCFSHEIMYVALAGFAAMLVALIMAGFARTLISVLSYFRNKIGRGTSAILVLLAFVCTIFAQKSSTNTSHGAFLGSRPLMVTPSQSDLREGDVASSIVYPLNFTPTNLAFFAFEKGLSWADFGLAWPAGNRIADSIGIYMTDSLITGRWEFVENIDVISVASNLVARVNDCSSLPCVFYQAVWNVDSDGDELSDWEELYVYHTNPYKSDTDDDGMNDGWEVLHDYDPCQRYDFNDTDGDRLPDEFEIEYGLNSYEADTDGDGVLDGKEIRRGSNPLNDDTDGDGISDGEEERLGLNPCVYDECSTVVDDACLLEGAVPVQFSNRVENTSAPGPNYEMRGTYDVHVAYDQISSQPGFCVLGAEQPEDDVVRSGDTMGTWYNTSSPYHTNKFSIVASGARFAPLKTGRYLFEVSADDHATVIIGATNDLEITTDFYNPAQAQSVICIAGEEYPVQIFADNNRGGPASLSFPTWGAFSPINKPVLNAAFSRDTIIYENEYQNWPGGLVQPKRSTKSCYSVEVSGGDLGGELSFETQNIDKLVATSGNVNSLNETHVITANESRRIDVVFEGMMPSDQTNDVVIIAKFDENRTRIRRAVTNTLTVVQLWFDAGNGITVLPNRHVFGPLEETKVFLNPSEVVSEWCVNMKEWHGSDVYVDEADIIHMASRPCFAECKMYVNQTQFNVGMRVIPPSDVTIQSMPVELTANEMATMLGKNARERWCGMIISNLVVSPNFVRFNHIQILEGYCPASDLGGFCKDIYLSGHGVREGAWRPMVVLKDNKIDGYDVAGYNELPWDQKSWGKFCYHIPCFWKGENDSNDDLVAWQTKDQKYYIFANGTFVVEKFGYHCERDVNGHAHINKEGEY